MTIDLGQQNTEDRDSFLERAGSHEAWDRVGNGASGHAPSGPDQEQQRRLESIRGLARGVAHEINNPLASILLCSEMLMSEEPPGPVLEGLRLINSETRRAASIVRRLVCFADTGEPRMSHTSLTMVVEKALSRKSRDLRVRGIEVVTEWSRDVPGTFADEQQLVQVVLAILDNAQQAIASYRAEGRVILRTSRSGERIRLSISDNGPGIAPEDLARVFDPFFTTREVGEGSGLGLSFCHGIVRRHGGKLWAESAEGKGTTFHMELPPADPHGDVGG